MIYYLQFYLNIKKKESRQAHVGILVSRKFIILLLQRYDIFSFQPNLRFEKNVFGCFFLQIHYKTIDLCQESVTNTPILLQIPCTVTKNPLPLHRVFHSIRFKVNKGWDLAKSLFLCLFVNYLSFANRL